LLVAGVMLLPNRILTYSREAMQMQSNEMWRFEWKFNIKKREILMHVNHNFFRLKCSINWINGGRIYLLLFFRSFIIKIWNNTSVSTCLHSFLQLSCLICTINTYYCELFVQLVFFRDPFYCVLIILEFIFSSRPWQTASIKQLWRS
jgi:hypothetical protein